MEVEINLKMDNEFGEFDEDEDMDSEDLFEDDDEEF